MSVCPQSPNTAPDIRVYVLYKQEVNKRKGTEPTKHGPWCMAMGMEYTAHFTYQDTSSLPLNRSGYLNSDEKKR